MALEINASQPKFRLISRLAFILDGALVGQRFGRAFCRVFGRAVALRRPRAVQARKFSSWLRKDSYLSSMPFLG